MKLSYNWLSDFVTFSEKDPAKIAEALTLSLAEVEEVEAQGELLENCCVGQVLSISKHPNADKLSLCDVETDRGKKRVVCGGTNLHEGMLVAFAHVGAKVKWHGGELMELAKTKIRGEESEGMICAASELGLEDMFPGAGEREIVDLEGRTKDKGQRTRGDSVGESLRGFLGLDDVIFHIDNHAITHRADLFSQIGFARECVALGLARWKKQPKPFRPQFLKTPLPFTSRNDAKKLIPHYLACMLSIEGVGETPEGMKKRLIAVGSRPLSLPIDITNYVMWECGMPLHSFDADDFAGTVHFRTAKDGERIVTLDGVERNLPCGAIVLSDDRGIFDLLGIMGGLRSSTKETTKCIYLHSAILDPVSIRKTIIAAGLRTDAATIYEKGVQLITAEQGFYRALELFLTLVPGAKITSKLESFGGNGKPEPIAFSLTRASSLLGREVKAKEATKILQSLDFAVKSGGKNTLCAAPPLHRLGDIHGEVDLIEEIARVAGFASFPEMMPEASITPSKRDNRTNKIRDTLKEAGFTELVQYAFLGEELLPKDSGGTLREIENPLGEDMKYLRPSLLPRLLAYAADNRKFTEDVIRLFEVGHIFTEDEHQSLALLAPSFLEAKRTLTEISAAVGIPFTFDRDGKPASGMHPGRTARILVNGSIIGSLFELNPALKKCFDLPERLAAAEMNFDLLLQEKSSKALYREPFTFPSITYDTTVVLRREVAIGALLEKVRRLHAFLRDVRLVDIFEKDGKRHCTFRCTYNAGDRTLAEEEVKPIHNKIEMILGQQ